MHPFLRKEVFEVLNTAKIKVLHIFKLLKDKQDNRQKYDDFFVSGKFDAKQKSFREVLDEELEKYK